MVKTYPDKLKLPELEIALENSCRVSPFRHLLFLFWGLIMAKCFLIQWAITHFNASVDGLVYVWIPSIIFGAVCTLFYIRISFGEFKSSPLTNRLTLAIWGSCLVCMLIFTLASVFFNIVEHTVLPGLLAVVMGAGYYIHSVLDHRRLFQFCALGWWLSAVWLLYRQDTDSFAWIALTIIAFHAIPTCVIYSNAVRESKKLAFQMSPQIKPENAIPQVSGQ